MQQRLKELFKLNENQRKEIYELKHEEEKVQLDTKRSSAELLKQQEIKETHEKNIILKTKDIARGREQKLLEQEYIRRTTNANNLIKKKI